MPYWDVAHDQAVPAWVQAFQPQGGTAMVPPDLPKGHPLYGKPVGSRYDIHFGRWPGNNPAFDRLPQPAQVAGIIGHDDFPGFYRAVEAEPAIVPSAVPAAKQALETLDRRFPDNADIKTDRRDRQPFAGRAQGRRRPGPQRHGQAARRRLRRWLPGHRRSGQAPSRPGTHQPRPHGRRRHHLAAPRHPAPVGRQGSTPPTPRCAAPSATSTSSPSTPSSG